MAGTPEYLSPEQGLGQKADIRADIYSLGVVLYELAAGRHPFKETQSSVAMIYQHVHTEPPPLEQLDPKCPPALRALIHRCLQKDPDARYENPDELLKAIQTARRNMDLPPSSKRMVAAPGRPRSLRALAFPLAGLILASGGIVGWKVYQSQRPAAVPDGAYELALGVGNPTLAKQLAESRQGRDSKEYREAERRERALELQPLEERARERFAARDWTTAADAYARLQPLIEPERRIEIDAALQFCRSLARAAELESKGDWAGALEAYRRLQSPHNPCGPHLEESLRRVQGKLDASHPR
jgi:hypothetical protein